MMFDQTAKELFYWLDDATLNTIEQDLSQYTSLGPAVTGYIEHTLTTLREVRQYKERMKPLKPPPPIDYWGDTGV